VRDTSKGLCCRQWACFDVPCQYCGEFLVAWDRGRGQNENLARGQGFQRGGHYLFQRWTLLRSKWSRSRTLRYFLILTDCGNCFANNMMFAIRAASTSLSIVVLIVNPKSASSLIYRQGEGSFGLKIQINGLICTIGM